MQNPLERERSVKKLHFCISNYHPTPQEKSALITAQQDLKDKIQFKFRRSSTNQNYVFPRKQTTKDQYADSVQVVNLNNQVQFLSESQQKQKPKIKLAKGRTDKRLQTQHFDHPNDENLNGKHQECKSSNYNSKPLAESNNYNRITPYVQAKQRIKTEYKEQSTRRIQPVFPSTLQRDSTLSRGKSKLNMLTKSYMNLKSGKQPLQLSIDPRANSIRTNDYKFMPSSSNHRSYATNTSAGFNSTRQLKNLLYGTSHYPDNTVKDLVDTKSLQKIQSLLPNRRYFKAK